MLRVGGVELRVLDAGGFPLRRRRDVRPGAESVVWQKLVTPDADNRIRLSIRPLLVRAPGATVLIDTGLGRATRRPRGRDVRAGPRAGRRGRARARGCRAGRREPRDPHAPSHGPRGRRGERDGRRPEARVPESALHRERAGVGRRVRPVPSAGRGVPQGRLRAAPRRGRARSRRRRVRRRARDHAHPHGRAHRGAPRGRDRRRQRDGALPGRPHADAAPRDESRTSPGWTSTRWSS